MGIKSSKPRAKYSKEPTLPEHKAKTFTVAPAGQPSLHEGSILGVATTGNDFIYSCSDDKRIAVVDLKRLKDDVTYRANYLEGHTKAVNKCFAQSFQTDDNDYSTLKSYCWSVSRDLTLRQWDVEQQSCLQSIPDAHSLNITGIAASSCNPNVLCTGSRDYSVKVWDIVTGKLRAEYNSPRNIVTTMMVHPVDEYLLLQGSEDLCVRFWDIRSPSHRPPAQIISGFVYFPVSMDIHTDGHLLATGCKGFDSVGCVVKLWDLRNTQCPVMEFEGHSQDVVGCKFHIRPSLNKSADSDDAAHLLVSASKDGSVCAWDFGSIATVTNAPSSSSLGRTTAFKTVADCQAITTTGKYITCLENVAYDDHVTNIGAGKGCTDSSLESTSVNYDQSTNTKCASQYVVGANDGSVSLLNVSSANNKHKRSIDIVYNSQPFFDCNNN